MDKHLIGFITENGDKHLGYYTPIVNPCADYWESDSIIRMYTDEFGNEYKDVIEEFPVCEIPLYSWDEQSNSYQLLPPPAPSTLSERMAHLFSKDLITEEKSIRLGYLWKIREWLYLNAKCSQPVYIDKDFIIHSDGEIVLKSDIAQSKPNYITIINS